MTRPSFHIVVPSYNQYQYLSETVTRLFDCCFNDIEIQAIVIDGGSTDGSVKLLRSINNPRLHWTSEPDRGQSDAINKGMAAAKGDVVGWLNSDDLYEPGALATVLTAFEQNPQVQWVIGDCRIIDEKGQTIRKEVSRYKSKRLKRYSYKALLRENFISQMSVFWRREFGESVMYPERKLLDESLHYAMDYDLWLRMGQRAEPLILPDVLACFRLHSQSKSGAVQREQFDEQYRVAKRYFKGDRMSQLSHRLNVEKVVWAYRAMRLLGR